jgi:hypothetical protein
MELVSATEAARQLGIHASQITRGIQSGLIPTHTVPGVGKLMINVEEAREARQRGLDRSKQRGPQSPLFAVSHAAEASAVARESPPLTPVTVVTSVPRAVDEPAALDDDARDANYQTARARRESAAATKAEIELAQLRGRTLDRGEVANTAFRLGQMLREGMETRRVALAQSLSGLDVAAMISVLADADESHLAALADVIERKLASEEVAVAA